MFRKEDLPRGWKIKKLSEICDVRDGTHDSPQKSEGYPSYYLKMLRRVLLTFLKLI